MKPYALLFTILVTFALIAPVSAVIYVKWDSPGPTLDGKSWETAFHTIAEGLNAAAAGGEVHVARGRYPEGLNMPEGAKLYGGYLGAGDTRDIKANVTFIDGLWTYNPASMSIVFVNNDCVLDGFTVRGFCPVNCFSGFTISNNTLIGVNYNSGDESIGIRCEFAMGTIINNTIIDADYGIWGYWSEPRVVGNVIVGSGICGIDLSRCSGEIINNTVVGCSDGIYNGWGCTVINNIIAFNRNIGLSLTASEAVRNNCSYGNGFWNYPPYEVPGYPAMDESNISVDPQFVSLEYGDLHLKRTSPCRNSGDAFVALPEIDFDGQARIDLHRVDIGADESYGEEYEAVRPRIIYVDAEAAPGGDGTSWERAYRTIQEGIDPTLLERPAEIWVAKGIYTGFVKMNPFVQLYGGFAGAETDREARDLVANVTTIVAPGSEYFNWAVIGSGPCIIDGFTLSGGSAGIYCFNNEITIQNCTATGNINGIFCEGGDPILVRNRVYGNTGVGVVASGTGATVLNNVISDNDEGLHLFALYNFIACGNTVANNHGVGILYNRQAFQEGDYFVKNVLAGNIVVSNEIGIDCDGGQRIADPSLVMNNDVFGNTVADYRGFSGTPAGDISADPLFIDGEGRDYHLSAGSPCIDAGYPVSVLPAFDIDGRMRISGLAVDIGAYEFQSGSVAAIIDIRPGESPNYLNPRSHAVLPVAVFSSGSFDATTIDIATVTFAGAPVAKASGNGKFMCDMRDLNRDGRRDAIIKFETDKMTIAAGAASATLSGRTTTGVLIEGSDSVVVAR